MRAFIGIETASATPAFLRVARFVSVLSGGEPVRKNNIHINMKFLGDISDTYYIKEAMENAFYGAKEIFLSADCIVNLPKYGMSWCLIGGDVERLAEYKRRLDEELAPLGYKAGGGDYLPHVTLSKNGYKKWDNNNIYVEKSVFRVSRVMLYESVVENGECFDIPIYAANLRGGESERRIYNRKRMLG